MKFIKELEQHLAKLTITYLLAGLGIFVAFYFTTTNVLAQHSESIDTIKNDVIIIKKKVYDIEKEPTKVKVAHLEHEVAENSNKLDYLQKKQNENHNEIMHLLLQMKNGD